MPASSSSEEDLQAFASVAVSGESVQKAATKPKKGKRKLGQTEDVTQQPTALAAHSTKVADVLHRCLDAKLHFVDPKFPSKPANPHNKTSEKPQVTCIVGSCTCQGSCVRIFRQVPDGQAFHGEHPNRKGQPAKAASKAASRAATNGTVIAEDSSSEDDAFDDDTLRGVLLEANDIYKTAQKAAAKAAQNVSTEIVGDVFIDEGDPRDVAAPNMDTFALAKEVQLHDTPIRESMNALARLGFHCRCLQNFVKLQDARAQHQNSACRRALARGISEVLDVYKNTVLRLQHYLQVDSRVPLSAMQQFLFEYQIVLPALHHAIHEIHHKEMTGPDVLKLLYSKSHSGVPVLQSCFRRLLWHCNMVLYRHLTAWYVYLQVNLHNPMEGILPENMQLGGSLRGEMMCKQGSDWIAHGMLLDSSDEFFITHSSPIPASEAATEGDDKENYSVHSQEWHSGFEVVPENVPPYISPAVASNVLFVGKAVRILQQPLQAAPEGSNRDPQGAPRRGLLTEEEALGFAEALHELRQRSTFDHLAFEMCISDIKGKVAERLWQLAVVSADLPRHLTILREYFLMAKGDFFQCFLLEGKSLLALPPKLATAESDIMLPFQQAASKVGADQDPLFANVRITFKLATTVSVTSGAQMATATPVTRSLTTTQAKLDGRTLYVPAYDKWDGISMEYDLQWPLHLLLTQDVLAKYGVVFQYLLRLKRLQLALEDAWSTMRHYTATDAAHHRRILKLWSLRHHMAYVMTNLQIYVQVDVIEAQYAKLVEDIQNARDFNEAEQCHNNFIDALLLQSFLDLRQIMALLEAMMSLCHRMCVMVQQASGPLGVNSLADSVNEQKVDSISTDFWRRAKMLYIALQSNKLQASNRAPYLRQFLLRLNFNGYIEKEIQKQAAAAGP